MEGPQKCLTVRQSNFSHVQIHCACQWIMTLAPRILALAAVLNTWRVTNFEKSSFYHTNHTFLTSINVWLMVCSSINARIKKIWSPQNIILPRKCLGQKHTFRDSEITIFSPWQYPAWRAIGNLPPLAYIYISLYGIYIYPDSSRLNMTMPWAPSHFANVVWILHFPRTEVNAASEWLEFFGTGALFRYPLQTPGAHLCHQQHMRVIPQRRFSTFFSMILCSNKCRQWLSFRTPVDISFRPRLICCRRRAV